MNTYNNFNEQLQRQCIMAHTDVPRNVINPYLDLCALEKRAYQIERIEVPSGKAEQGTEPVSEWKNKASLPRESVGDLLTKTMSGEIKNVVIDATTPLKHSCALPVRVTQKEQVIVMQHFPGWYSIDSWASGKPCEFIYQTVENNPAAINQAIVNGGVFLLELYGSTVTKSTSLNAFMKLTDNQITKDFVDRVFPEDQREIATPMTGVSVYDLSPFLHPLRSYFTVATQIWDELTEDQRKCYIADYTDAYDEIVIKIAERVNSFTPIHS